MICEFGLFLSWHGHETPGTPLPSRSAHPAFSCLLTMFLGIWRNPELHFHLPCSLFTQQEG